MISRQMPQTFSSIELSERDIPAAINSEFGFDVENYFSTRNL